MILSDEELRQKLAQAWEEGVRAAMDWADPDAPDFGVQELAPRNPHLRPDEQTALRDEILRERL